MNCERCGTVLVLVLYGSGKCPGAKGDTSVGVEAECRVCNPPPPPPPRRPPPPPEVDDGYW